MNGAYILGTAQLGQPYGIANASGQPDMENAVTIVRTALNLGVSFFDTARAYGESERVLGHALRRCNAEDGVEVITKLPPALPATPRMLAESLRDSMRKLGVSRLYCLMLHREEHLAALNTRLGEELRRYRSEGVIRNIGISVYSPEAALAALQNRLISVVQIPASLFDRRFENAGVFMKARETGKELHLRSIFLQGVLCMRPDELPSFLGEFIPALSKFRALCHEYACMPNRAALLWILRRRTNCRICFGAENPDQVRQNLDSAALNDILPDAFFAGLEAILPPQKPEILNPALWPRCRC
ncbi:MAG: aldo/keto reductase [Desulfovibrio sp.]|jgi:aryl-alcohol dehydrogenase-like predicted oxidoreductase|nr:aldo/keto reductase [Desulfovibrio sp.]